MDGTSRRKTAKTIIRLISALEHIKMSEISLNNMSYNFAVYHSQQACEMSMKACLASVDLEDIFTHRVSGIFANRVINEVSEDLRMEFQSLLSKISELEFKYIPSRYDTVDETGHLIAPFLEFDIDDAKDTLDTATSLIDLCFRIINMELGMELPQDASALKEILKEYSDVVKVD